MTRSGISRRTTRACVSARAATSSRQAELVERALGADPVTVAFALTLLALGFVGAFVAGLPGVGGAIVMNPLLLYPPPPLVGGGVGLQTVAGGSVAPVLRPATAGPLAP